MKPPVAHSANTIKIPLCDNRSIMATVPVHIRVLHGNDDHLKSISAILDLLHYLLVGGALDVRAISEIQILPRFFFFE